jgi:hypothetical protein
VDEQVHEVGGFLGLAAYASDRASLVLYRFLTLKAEHGGSSSMGFMVALDVVHNE